MAGSCAVGVGGGGRATGKVSRIHLLAGVRDLTAHRPQSLEAVPDGVDVCHAHEHHLAVGVVFCVETHAHAHAHPVA